MKKLIVLGVVATSVLVACGGGGGGGSTPAAGVTAANPFAADAGTYRFDCKVVGTSSTPEYSTVIVVVEAPSGSDKANVTIQNQDFIDANCATAPTLDITVRGDLSALAATKTITGVGSEKSGTVKTAEFAYSGITFTKTPVGGFGGTLPLPGTKAKVGYLIEGNKVFGLSGSRALDGLPTSFSKNFLIKQ